MQVSAYHAGAFPAGENIPFDMCPDEDVENRFKVAIADALVMLLDSTTSS